MTPRVLVLALALASALAPPAGAQDAPADYAADALTRRFEALRPALEAELGRPFGEVTVIPSTRRELAALIADENEALLGELEGGSRGEELRRQCDAEADTVSALCFGKVDLRRGGVRIVPDTFGRFASVAPEWSAVTGQRFLDVVVIHEAVHIAQDRAHGLLAFVGKPRTIEELRARYAVIEGHAQWVTRRVAARLGLEGAFRLFADTISTVPAGATSDPAVRMLLETHTSNSAFQYVEGERFFAALVEAQGGAEAALARAFGAPPRTFREVSHPDEYLAPPAAPGVDVKAIAQAALELLPDGWRTAVVPLPEPTLRTVFAPGGDALVTRALAAYRDGAVAVGASPAGAQMTIAIMRAASPEAAADLVACEEALGRAKDELFKGDAGAFTITAAAYAAREVTLEGEARAAGVVMTKEMTVRGQGQVIHATTFVVARGDLVVEASSVGLAPADPDELDRVARGVFERAAAARGSADGPR